VTALTDATVEEHVEAGVAEAAEPAISRARAPVARRVAAITAIVLASAAVLAFILLAYEGPFGDAWYSVRQHARTADFNALHEHTGRGRAIAILQIPRIGLSTVVAEGDSAAELRGGPGHRIGTPLPGSVGNAVVLGHRAVWGGPFAHLDQLEAGDLIAVQTHASDGTSPTAAYTVLSVKPASADDPSPFATSDDHRLTLITSRGGRYSSDRLVVTAVSGKPGRTLDRADVQSASPPRSSSATRDAGALALLGIAGAVLAWFLLRRRHQPVGVAVVVAPLAIIGLLGVLLDVDLFLPVLR
jgi:LPXTG-site transpeptidase (sortase) family protein